MPIRNIRIKRKTRRKINLIYGKGNPLPGLKYDPYLSIGVVELYQHKKLEKHYDKR
jgi:hypothetical protein